MFVFIKPIWVVNLCLFSFYEHDFLFTGKKHQNITKQNKNMCIPKDLSQDCCKKVIKQHNRNYICFCRPLVVRMSMCFSDLVVSKPFWFSLSSSSVIIIIFMQDINQEKWEKDIRSAASLDELLMLTDFPDWKLWRCRLKLKRVDSASFPEFRSASVGSHRFTRFAANSYSLEVLKGSSTEIRI